MPENYYSTFQQDEPKQDEPKKNTGVFSRIRFYVRRVRWLWNHRTEPNNRHKWRRMMREVQE